MADILRRQHNNYIMNSEIKQRAKISFSNIFTGILMLFMLAMLFSPDFKGLVSQNLMKIGLFQPNVPNGPTEAVAGIDADVNNDEILFKNPDGHVIELSDLKGKVIFINFWATWCPPCIAEMPSSDKLHSAFRNNDKVMFLMVDVDNERAKSEKFM